MGCHMTSAAESSGPTGRNDHSTFKYDAFISHSHADLDTVARIAERLREAGISYWLDAEQITFGDPVVGKIEDGLRDSRFVVAVLSAGLVKSGWCRAEYGSVLNRELSGDASRRVIPLSLDGTVGAAAIPMLLVDKLRVDFTSDQSMAEFIKFLKSSRGTA
jgi:TIR domain